MIRRICPATRDSGPEPRLSARAAMCVIAALLGATQTAGAAETPQEAPRVEPAARPFGAGPKAPAGSPAPPAVLPCEAAPSGMACVEGGWFWRGSDDGPANERPREPVWLQTFYMDTHEVTVGQYRACRRKGRCRRAKTAYVDYSRPQQPKVGGDWFAFRDFCAVHGKRLPTEAQWEKAARGPDGRRFPWGDEPATCERAIIKDKRGRRSCGVEKKRGSHPEKGRTLAVGTRPPNPYGLYDMAGNSWEWVADWYSPSYARCGDACRGAEPRGPCHGADRCRGHRRKLVRGGSWYWPAAHATTTFRRAHVPGNDPYHHFGFRCAATVEQARALRAQEAR
jgi:formylglycine-generating enzyme required for sulfatase activity